MTTVWYTPSETAQAAESRSQAPAAAAPNQQEGFSWRPFSVHTQPEHQDYYSREQARRPSRSDSFESLLSLNVLAATLLEEDVPLDSLASGEHAALSSPSLRNITLPYFSTRVVGPQRYSFPARPVEEEQDNETRTPVHPVSTRNVGQEVPSQSDKGEQALVTDRPFDNLTVSSLLPAFEEQNPSVGHVRNTSTGTNYSSVPSTLETDSPGSRFSGKTYGSNSQETLTRTSASVHRPSYDAKRDETSANGGIAIIGQFTRGDQERSADAEKVHVRQEVTQQSDGPAQIAPGHTVMGSQGAPQQEGEEQKERHDPLRSPVPDSVRISDWLKQQYDNPTRQKFRETVATPEPSTARVLRSSDAKPRAHEFESPSTFQSMTTSHSTQEALSSLPTRTFASAPLSTRFSSSRTHMLHDILERDFGGSNGDENIINPPSREMLWHPSEYVGPIRRSRSNGATVTFSKLANQGRSISSDLLERRRSAATTNNRNSLVGKPLSSSRPAIPMAHASMNDLLLRDRNDPRRKEAERRQEARRERHPLLRHLTGFAQRGRMHSRTLKRSLSGWSEAFFSRHFGSSGGTNANRESAPSPHGVESDLSASLRQARTRSPSFVVYSRSPTSERTVPEWSRPQAVPSGIGQQQQGRDKPGNVLKQNSTPNISSSSTAPPARPPPPTRTTSHSSSTTKNGVKRSVKRINEIIRSGSGGKKAKAGQSEKQALKREQEADWLSMLAREQVTRDANYRAEIVDRFTLKREGVSATAP